MRAQGSEHAGNSATVVVFDCAGIRCALRREAVSRIIALPTLQRPPNLPSPVAGFVNHAGQTIPVLRAALLLGRDEPEQPVNEDPYRHVLLVQSGSNEFGLMVDRVIDVVRIDADTVRPAKATDTLNGSVEAVIEVSPAIHLLTPSRILLNGERLRLAGLVAAEQARIEAWQSE